MSDEKRGFRRLPNGDVQLTMSRDDCDRLLLALGVATGAAEKSGSILNTDKVLGLLNRLFDGDPAYTPYYVSEREREAPYTKPPAFP